MDTNTQLALKGTYLTLRSTSTTTVLGCGTCDVDIGQTLVMDFQAFPRKLR